MEKTATNIMLRGIDFANQKFHMTCFPLSLPYHNNVLYFIPLLSQLNPTYTHAHHVLNNARVSNDILATHMIVDG